MTEHSERYWEARWRDEKAENERLNAEVRRLASLADDMGQTNIESQREIERLLAAMKTDGKTMLEWHMRITRLTEENKRLRAEIELVSK